MNVAAKPLSSNAGTSKKWITVQSCKRLEDRRDRKSEEEVNRSKRRLYSPRDAVARDPKMGLRAQTKELQLERYRWRRKVDQAHSDSDKDPGHKSPIPVPGGRKERCGALIVRRSEKVVAQWTTDC